MNSFLRDNELFEYESEVGKENISKYLVKMSVGEYVPIIFNYNALFGDKDIDNKLDDPQESLMSIAYVKKYTPQRTIFRHPMLMSSLIVTKRYSTPTSTISSCICLRKMYRMTKERNTFLR